MKIYYHIGVELIEDRINLSTAFGKLGFSLESKDIDPFQFYYAKEGEVMVKSVSVFDDSKQDLIDIIKKTGQEVKANCEKNGLEAGSIVLARLENKEWFVGMLDSVLLNSPSKYPFLVSGIWCSEVHAFSESFMKYIGSTISFSLFDE